MMLLCAAAGMLVAAVISFCVLIAALLLGVPDIPALGIVYAGIGWMFGMPVAAMLYDMWERRRWRHHL